MSLKVAIAGASGYVGGELARLVAEHPQLDLVTVTANTNAGERFINLHPHLQSVNIFARGDEEQVAVFAAEGDVRGPRLGHVDVFDLLPGLVEHGHAAAGEIHVAFAIEGHAVRAKIAEECLVRKRAIRLDGIAVGLACRNVGNGVTAFAGMLRCTGDA